MSDDIFKSAEAREQIEEWYQRFLAKLEPTTEHLSVPTSQGDNHVLALGDASNPPLVLIHGAMGSSAHTASEIDRLARHYYILAPDIPGQSVRGLPERLSLKDRSHGRWLIELLDALELQRTHICAVSWGGFVGLELASMAPERIDGLALVVPAGVVGGPFWKATTKLMFPLAMYKMFSGESRLRKLMEGMMTTWDDDWAHYLGDALRCFKMDFRPPPLFSPEQLADFERPALVVAAEKDLSFSGPELIERMGELIPHAETELIEGARHMPPTTDEFRDWLAERIRTFLEPADAPRAAAAAR